MRVAGAIVGGLCVSACSLLTSLDDLRSGADAGGIVDAADAGTTTIAYVQGRVVHDSPPTKVASRTVTVSIPNVTAHDAIVVGVVGYQSGAPLTTITAT